MGNSINERISELDPNFQGHTGKQYQLSADPRFKQIQKEWTENREKKLEKVSEVAEVSNQAAVVQPKVEIKSQFKWDKDAKGQYEIRPKEKRSLPFDQWEVPKVAGKIIGFLGYKIDLSDQVQTLMEKYQKFYIEARSHNFLLSKFAELKFGMVHTVLTLMGVSSEELKSLQRKALNAGVEENERLFEQNEYNLEMLTVFSTSKKDKSRQQVFKEVTKQLVSQMERLGRKNYYSQDRVVSVKLKVVRKIFQELLQEKQTLSYMRDFQS